MTLSRSCPATRSARRGDSRRRRRRAGTRPRAAPADCARRARRGRASPGAPVAQRWERGRQAGDPGESRVDRDAQPRRGHGAPRAPSPRVLVSASAVGYYGPRGDERLDESAGRRERLPGPRSASSGSARRAAAADRRHARVVLMRRGSCSTGRRRARDDAPPFKLGVGGPIGGGDQYMPWIHIDDLIGLYLPATRRPAFSGPVNVTAPEPVTNKEFRRRSGAHCTAPPSLPFPGSPSRACSARCRRSSRRPARGPGAGAALGYEFRAPGPRRGAARPRWASR